MKLLGSLLLAVAGYGAGLWRLRLAQRRLDALRQLYLLLGRIRDEIAYRALPLDEILFFLRQDDGFSLLELDACKQLQKYRLPGLFTREECAALEPAFAMLGQGTSPETCRSLVYYQRRCFAFTEQAEKTVDKAKQLYSPFGLCCGLMTALLLL